jgi:hypothetical protein
MIHPKKSKFVALNSKGKSIKSLQVVESKEDTQEEDLAEDFDEDEMAFLSKRFQYLNKKKRFHERSSDARGSSFRDKKDDPKVFFNCKKPGLFVGDCLDLRKDIPKKESSKKEAFKNIVDKISSQCREI